MKLKVIDEAGYYPALFGLGLSHGLTSEIENFMGNDLFDRLEVLARKLAPADGGHNKFLESIAVWLDIDAPRFWWSEMDTYRVGITKQSESTMHTLGKRELTDEDFEGPIHIYKINFINSMVADREPVEMIKMALPEGFLQRRIVCTNYKTLRNIIQQRRTHKLPQWRYFCAEVVAQVQHPELLPSMDTAQERANQKLIDDGLLPEVEE